MYVFNKIQEAQCFGSCIHWKIVKPNHGGHCLAHFIAAMDSQPLPIQVTVRCCVGKKKYEKLRRHACMYPHKLTKVVLTKLRSGFALYVQWISSPWMPIFNQCLSMHAWSIYPLLTNQLYLWSLYRVNSFPPKDESYKDDEAVRIGWRVGIEASKGKAWL